ncbi:MAG: DNA-directed RNA polymerase subunit omega [Bacteroidales bacterium]|nr:DNA-directed RNA polymerase subunit omega [Bacteroidales bacterium]
MNYKKVKLETEAITRNIREIENKCGNIYEAVVIIARRAKQISTELKEQFKEEAEAFSTKMDTLEEITENKELIELARSYERLPKPTILALHEFLNNKIYYRLAENENMNQ